MSSNLYAGFPCAECGAEAGTIRLDLTATGGRVQRQAFTGRLTLSVTREASGRLSRALEARDSGALFAVDPELAPWYCPGCESSYCGDHWVRWDVFDEVEPNWHDSIRGRCPKGHERMLED